MTDPADGTQATVNRDVSQAVANQAMRGDAQGNVWNNGKVVLQIKPGFLSPGQTFTISKNPDGSWSGTVFNKDGTPAGKIQIGGGSGFATAIPAATYIAGDPTSGSAAGQPVNAQIIYLNVYMVHCWLLAKNMVGNTTGKALLYTDTYQGGSVDGLTFGVDGVYGADGLRFVPGYNTGSAPYGAGLVLDWSDYAIGPDGIYAKASGTRVVPPEGVGPAPLGMTAACPGGNAPLGQYPWAIMDGGVSGAQMAAHSTPGDAYRAATFALNWNRTTVLVLGANGDVFEVSKVGGVNICNRLGNLDTVSTGLFICPAVLGPSAAYVGSSNNPADASH